MTKTEDARALIMRTADALFFEHGYDAVGVADICKAAGKAKGLFFYYFEKKENVVKELTEAQMKQMAEQMTASLSTMDISAVAKLNFIMNALLSNQSAGPRAMAYFKTESIPEWFDFFAHDLKDTYIYPIIQRVVKSIAKDNAPFEIQDTAIEIIYLGISAFMHKNYHKMASPEYYSQAVLGIAATLEDALHLPSGTILIK